MNKAIRTDITLKLLQWYDGQRDPIYQLACMLQKDEFDVNANQQLIADAIHNLSFELKLPVSGPDDDNNGIGRITKEGVTKVTHLLSLLHVLSNPDSYVIVAIAEDRMGCWTITSTVDATKKLFIQNDWEQREFVESNSVVALDASLQTADDLIEYIGKGWEPHCAIGKDTWQAYFLEN
jgi:hypothetical protein